MIFVETADLTTKPASFLPGATLATTVTLPLDRRPVVQAVEEAAWFCEHWNVQYYAALVEQTTKVIVADVVHRSWFEDQPWLRARAVTVRIRWVDPATLVIEAWDLPAARPGHPPADGRYRLYRMARLRVGNPLIQIARRYPTGGDHV
ncbi:hypothetical protein [Nocardia sp. XZ_19_369]|uniref:hypothetical protein n=1 Tax=Nocardia sp. XZ_19_369 TaxID=2769487 RepID=UPI0018903EB3|nr:hypothetical protein [Nocardia sp. XZ_19_369]